MRILVTGANGQLGNEMQVLAKENPQHLYYFTDVQELDICDKEAVWSYISEKQIDVIVNCAAYTAVDKAEDNRELAHKLNSVAPGILARAAQANNAAMIQVSTDYVFDGTAHTPYAEECKPCPDSIYGSTKLEGEQEVMDHCEKAVVIRTAWLYSIYGNNFITCLNSRTGSGTFFQYRTCHGYILKGVNSIDRKNCCKNKKSKQYIKQRAPSNDKKFCPCRSLSKCTGIIQVVAIHSCNFIISAKRNGSKRVQCFSFSKRHYFRSKPDSKFIHFHSCQLRHKEMTDFMNDHDDSKNNNGSYYSI